MERPAVFAEGLVKRFGNVLALDGVDLEVPTGTVLGLLGPNGAGKTTAVRILTTLLPPDAGRAEVAGYDVVRDAPVVRTVIGLAGQNAAVDENLTGRENLELVGRLYHLGRTEARRRADELIERFALGHAADRTAKTYSGGMRRRLDLAASMVGQPRVLYLDEPTTGLDPRARSDLWEVIRALTSDGGGGRIGQGRTPPQGQGLAQQGPRARSGSQPSCWRPARAGGSKRTASTASASTASR